MSAKDENGTKRQLFSWAAEARSRKKQVQRHFIPDRGRDLERESRFSRPQLRSPFLTRADAKQDFCAEGPQSIDKIFREVYVQLKLK